MTHHSVIVHNEINIYIAMVMTTHKPGAQPSNTNTPFVIACTFGRLFDGKTSWCFFTILRTFLLGRGPFCIATGALYFGLQMTLPTGFKVRVDSLSPGLFCHLRATVPRTMVAGTRHLQIRVRYFSNLTLSVVHKCPNSILAPEPLVFEKVIDLKQI